jgi:hypothetical protein
MNFGKSHRQMAIPRTLEVRLGILNAIHELMTPAPPGLAAQKFDPNQPRVPAGNPTGGQWASAEVGDVSAIVATAKRLNLAARPDAYQKCLDLCYPLLERFQPPWSDRNTWDFHKCMNACLGRNL